MQIREFYSGVIGLTDDELIDRLCGYSEIVSVRSGTLITRQGEKQKYITFLLNGVFRGYYVDIDGKEITDCFGFRCGDPAMACSRLDCASEISIEAVIDSQCLRLPLKETVKLSQQYSELEIMYNEMLVQGINRHLAIKKAMQELDAMSRYQWFLKDYPGLIDIANNKDVASFIGITPVTLSRLRRTLRENN